MHERRGRERNRKQLGQRPARGAPIGRNCYDIEIGCEFHQRLSADAAWRCRISCRGRDNNPCKTTRPGGNGGAKGNPFGARTCRIRGVLHVASQEHPTVIRHQRGADRELRIRTPRVPPRAIGGSAQPRQLRIEQRWRGSPCCACRTATSHAPNKVGRNDVPRPRHASPNQSATVAPRSENVSRSPTGPPITRAPATSNGTRSRA